MGVLSTFALFGEGVEHPLHFYVRRRRALDDIAPEKVHLPAMSWNPLFDTTHACDRER